MVRFLEATPPVILTISGSGTMNLQSGNLNAFDVLNGTGGADPASLTINTVIAGDATAGVCIESIGAGHMSFNGVNTYLGGTYLGESPDSDPFSSPAILNYNNSASFGDPSSPIYLLDAQGGSLAVEGSTPVTIPNSVINYFASAQSFDLIGLPAPNGPTFSGAWVMSGGGGGAGATGYTTTAPLATYGPVNIGSGGAANNVVTISGVISGTNALTFYDVGIVALSATNTFSGPLTVNNGTLQLTGTGSINSVPTLTVATNGASGAGTLDVSAYPTYTLSSSTALAANGDGDGSGGSPATILGALGGTVDLGSRPINLTWTGGNGNGGSASLYISQGALKLNGNVISVNNASAGQLGAGYYTLIRVADGTSGIITGTPNAAVTVTGAGLAPGCTAAIQVGGPSFIGDASDIVMVVTQGTVVTIAPFAAVNHGTAPTLIATVTPDPTSGGASTVTFKNNGTAFGSAVTGYLGGNSHITIQPASLRHTHPITASFKATVHFYCTPRR